jgi:hypothetical protein
VLRAKNSATPLSNDHRPPHRLDRPISVLDEDI